MFKKVVFFLASVAMLFGCKGKNESDGDSYYKDGKYRNAVNSYTAALSKGKISDGFYDSFVIAYASAAKQTAKKNASDEIILSYTGQIHKNLPKTKKGATKDSVVLALSEIGLAQVLGGTGDYEYTLQGFNNLDSAISIAKRNGGSNAGLAESSRKKAEDAVVKQAIENSQVIENSADCPTENIATEYVLLEAEVVAPKNPTLKAALNKIRIKNRGCYLLFAEDIIGKRASRLVDKYGYVMSFPSLSIGPTSTTGELTVWNSTGNNVNFDVNTIKIVSTDGKEANAKYVGGGWCYMSDHLNKMKSQFKGSVGKLLSESTCNAKLSFTYPSGFIPDYIEVKDKDNNIGRKYFGQK